MSVTVKEIARTDALPMILNVHYAQRSPSISFAYGLFVDDNLEGIVTFGTPASAPLRKGICGSEFSGNVIELNRLCLLSNEKNHASKLVGAALRKIQGNRVVVSFADTSQNHVGYVYQATNFIYCGLSAKRTDWKVKGKEHLHGQTIADEFRGQKNRSDAMRKKYGDDFYLKPRPRKHRYVYFLGTKKFRKQAALSLNYKVTDYPKGVFLT